MRFLFSYYRVTTRSVFLAAALLVGLVIWYLPQLLNLDAFRPALVEVLESTFRCKVLVGDITAYLAPAPGLSVGHVVLLEDAKPQRVLASVARVRLSLAPASLLKGRMVIDAIRFIQPRFIVHQVLGPQGESRWALLKLPRAGASSRRADVNEWQVRSGRIEYWDHTSTPTSKWTGEQFTGTFRVREQTGAMVGKFVRLGQRALVDLHYDAANRLPLQVRFHDANLSAFQPLIRTPLFTFGGLADILFKFRIAPTLKIQAQLDQPAGAGQVTADIAPGPRGSWRWSAEGHHYTLNGTAFDVSEWSAKSDAEGLAVYLRGATREGGMAEVVWNRSPGAADATLGVDVSSVTVRQILEIFQSQSRAQTQGAGFNPYGYESWRIDLGSMQAVVHDGTSFEVKDSDVDLCGMHLDLQGAFDLAKSAAQAHIQGDLDHIPVPSLVESFFPAPSPLTGISHADFDLRFPLSADWIKGLNGTLQVNVEKGLLRTMKTVYRIASVLNLGNYLQLRLPKVNAQGVEFESLAGHFAVQNGVLASDDIFLKSPNMNVGAKGSLDIPRKRIKTTLRLEMFRFLEDLLRDVPITHWIFKKPNKIFLPIVVTVEGPWDDPEVH